MTVPVVNGGGGLLASYRRELDRGKGRTADAGRRDWHR